MFNGISGADICLVCEIRLCLCYCDWLHLPRFQVRRMTNDHVMSNKFAVDDKDLPCFGPRHVVQVLQQA